MKVLKVIGIVIAVLVVAIVVIGLIAPKEYTVTRSITVNAPQDVVYNNVRLFENFNKWEPWGKYDEGKTEVSLEGTDGAIGTKRSWKGPKTGEGSMTIKALEENKSVTWDLAFLKPYESHSDVTVSVTPAEGGQKVDWVMHGKMDFPFNAMGVFMPMDKMIGKDFEEGLKGLKTVSEAGGGAASVATYKIDEIEWAEKKYIAHRETVKFEELAAFFGKQYAAIAKEIGSQGAKPGIPVGVYYKYDEAAGNTDVAAAIPYAGKDVKAKGFDNLTLPAGKAYKIDYYGPYGDSMMPAYKAMEDFLVAKYNKKDPDLVVEEYVGDPMVEKDQSKLLTVIYFFVNDKTAAK